MRFAVRRGLMACLAAGVPLGASLFACGGTPTWDLGDAAANANGSQGSSGGCATPCISDQECQANCTSATHALYCCDLASSVGTMGKCYAVQSATCPSTAGGAVDAGRARVVDAGRRGRGGNQMND